MKVGNKSIYECMYMYTDTLAPHAMSYPILPMNALL